ncbi:MAG: glycoside hydrolase family 2 TIM barrel-domain containing protein [Lacunisphaera sp.]|nr:glycoside hydrolase family 2 TIM barrel-domain containing protein [Lacunisphaera sp.]
MKILFIALFISCAQLAAGALPSGYPETARRKISLNPGWQFHLGDAGETAARADFPDADWETVCIPHTLKLTSLALDGSTDDKFQKTFQREIAWYRRTFLVDPTGGSQVFLEFEGAHQVTDVWVNGRHVGQHAIGGYTPFDFDITGFVRRDGPNTLALRLDNTVNRHTPPDPGPFDYVKFSGLYRDVYLVQTDPVHVTFPWDEREAGVFVTTPTVHRDAATIAVRTTVRNQRPEARKVTVVTRIVDADGELSLKLRTTAEVPAGADHTFSQVGGIAENLRLWSPDSPYRYRVNTTILDGDTPVDCVENPLGIRQFELRANEGFFINGVLTKLIGTNRHQHFGYIGDALPDSLHWQDALQFKHAGFNVVRLAHYPQDNAFLDACDRLGILVYEEGPSWISIGDAEWQRNLELAERRMIRNHRNHPSVFLWGAGINHRSTLPALHFAAKDEDPTRLTGSNNSQWTGFQGAGLADVFTNMDYALVPEPDEMMFASEHDSSRDGERNQLFVSAYRGSVRRFGMAAWTAHAYYTFHPSTDPANRTRSGMMDAFRRPYPVMEWYRSELTTDPMVFIADPWIAGTKRVRVFSTAPEVELLINGRSLGRHGPEIDPNKQYLHSPPFVFPLSFEPGELVARAWRGDSILATQTVHTPGLPVALALDLDLAQRAWTADGADIVVGRLRVVDALGTTVPDGPTAISLTTEGPGAIVGDARIGANPVTTIDGCAPVLVRAGLIAGTVTIHATAQGLRSAIATASTQPFQPDVIAREARPIRDYDALKVDLGAVDQLVQFGWTPWNGIERQPSRAVFPDWGGFAAEVAPSTAAGVARWRGESNVKGRLGYVAGDGVCVPGGGGLRLTFTGLPAGAYRLISYHHVPRSNTDSMDPAKDNPAVADFNHIQSAIRLTFAVNDADGTRDAGLLTPVSTGTDLKRDTPSRHLLSFRSDGRSPVSLVITDAADPAGTDAVWLNGFELQRQL